MRGGAFPPIIPAESTASVQVMTSAACGCSPSGGVTADGGEFPRVRRRSSFGCFSGRGHFPLCRTAASAGSWRLRNRGVRRTAVHGWPRVGRRKVPVVSGFEERGVRGICRVLSPRPVPISRRPPADAARGSAACRNRPAGRGVQACAPDRGVRAGFSRRLCGIGAEGSPTGLDEEAPVLIV